MKLKSQRSTLTLTASRSEAGNSSGPDELMSGFNSSACQTFFPPAPGESTLMRKTRALEPATVRLLLLIASIASLALPLSAATYSNPVLPGDFPDPSVIRVGDEYWATATSSEWAPLFPLLRSRDLVNWEHVGNAFQKRPAWSVGNFWAPEIAGHNGKFYIYYVGRKKDGPLHLAVATADKPQGPWTDHGPMIGQPAGSIDAVPVTDENGDRYMLWKEDGNSRREPTPSWAQKLSNDGTRLVGEMKELIRNDQPWERNLVEGPFVAKRGDTFYLFYSAAGCCGAGCNYVTGVARSKKLLGPWEKNPANPILASNDDWRCPGHGSIVSTPDGRDYFLYHAYHARTFIYVGRQGVLDEVKWGADGWPTINAGQGVSTEAPAPLPLTATRHNLEFFDDFSGTALGPTWQWPANNEPTVKLAEGRLTLSPTADHAKELVGADLGKQTTTGNYAAVTSLDSASLKPGVSAGLSAFGDSANAIGVALSDGTLTLWKRQKGKHETLATTEAPAGKQLQLRLTAREGHKFHFAASADGRDWNEVGPGIDLEGKFLPPWDRGIRIALTVGGTVGASASFDSLRITP
jgi:beta-xylosidase